MKLTQQEVEHIAYLARLGLNEEEKERFTNQLSSILDYIKQLQAVNADGVEPTAQVTGLENVMRDDVVEQCPAQIIAELLANAPEVADNLIKTRSVF